MGYAEIRQVKRKNVAVKLIFLDSNIDYDNVGKSTGVDMHAHEVASHEIVLPADQDVTSLQTSLWTSGNSKLTKLRNRHSLLQVMCQIMKNCSSK